MRLRALALIGAPILLAVAPSSEDIGGIWLTSASAAFGAAFRVGLRDLAYIEGRNSGIVP